MYLRKKQLHVNIKTTKRNQRHCDWLLCLIFCLGFIVAMLIFIVIYALILHQHQIDNDDNHSHNNNDSDKNLAAISSSSSSSSSASSTIGNNKQINIINRTNELYLPSLSKYSLIESNLIYKSFKDEIDILKLPLLNDGCDFNDNLYSNKCEGEYFNNFTHYNDNWSKNIFIPDLIESSFNGKKSQFKKWSYNIINYPIIENYLTSSKERRDDILITIVTQTSMDRLNLLEIMASNWNGIISVAIYIRLEESLLHSLELILELFEKCENKYDYALLDISLLFEIEYLNKINNNGGLYSVMYPINHLRNLALQCAKTEFVLLIDGDFIPNKGFHDKAIKQYKYIYSNNNKQNKSIALVIPAFEFGSSYNFYTKRQKQKKKKIIRAKEEESVKNYNLSNLNLPLTKKEISSLYLSDKVRGFHIHRCTQCHKPTNYSKWLKNDEPYFVKYKASYEPYIMIKRINLRRYDARFRGYGWNKIIHLLTLAWIDKINWIVSNDCFIFHIPHYSSRDANNYFKGKASLRWKWIMGLSKLALRDLKKRIDQTGLIIA